MKNRQVSTAEAVESLKNVFIRFSSSFENLSNGVIEFVNIHKKIFSVNENNNSLKNKKLPQLSRETKLRCRKYSIHN